MANGNNGNDKSGGNGNNGNEYKKTQSRKWRLVIYILVLATLGVFLPPLLSVWLFSTTEPIVILTGGHFVTLVTLIVSAYFGANVWQKHVEARSYGVPNEYGPTYGYGPTDYDPMDYGPTDYEVTETTEVGTTTIIKPNEDGEA